MGNKNTIAIEIVVNDNGTATVKNFGSATERELKRAETAGNNLGAGFAKTWAGIAAGAAGAIYAFNQVVSTVAGSVKAFMDSESALFKLGMAMKNQGDYSRAALDDLVAYAEGLQKITAYEDDLLIAMMGNLKSYGMTNEEVKRATKIALDFATAKSNEGMTITTASELLGKAYAGNTQMLGRYGIMISDTIPKGERFAAVLDQLNARFGGSAQADLSTYAGQWKHIQNIWGDVQEFLGLVLLKSIEGLLVAGGLLATTFMTAGSAILGILRIVLSPFNLLLDGFAKLAELAGLTRTADALSSIANATKIAQENVQEAREGVLRWTASQYDALTATNKVTDAIEKSGIVGKRTIAIDEEAIAARKKAAEELAKLQAEDRKGLIEGLQAQMDADDNYYIELGKNRDADAEEKKKLEAEDRKGLLAGLQAQMDADDNYYIELAKNRDKDAEEKRRLAEQLPQMYRDVYEDIRGYEREAFEASKILINQQADAYEKAGMNQVVVAKWKAEEEKKTYLKMLKASDDWKDGVEAGLIEITNAHTTWGTTAYELTKQFASDASRAFGSNFKDIIKGDFSDLGSAWSSVLDNMLTKFGETLYNMLIEAAAKEIVLGFKTNWVDTGASVINFISTVLGIAGSGFSGGSGTNGGAGGGGSAVPSSGANVNVGYEGGWVPGLALGGNSRSNDIVPYMLSPQEYIVDRETTQAIAGQGRGGDTMLAHINMAEARLLKSLGGAGSQNPRTGLPEFFGFDSIFNVLTGGVSGAVTGNWGGTKDIWSFLNPGVVSAVNAANSSNVWDFIDAVFDPVTGPGLTNLLQASGKEINELIPWMGELIDAIAPVIGGLVGGIYGGPGGAAGGAAAGSGFASKWNSYPNDEAVKKAAITAAVTYVAGQAGSAAGSAAGSGTGSAVASKAVSYATAWLMNNLMGAVFPPEQGQVQFSYEGANDNGLFSSLGALMGDIAPKSNSFAFSALNGLNYVPRDNFRINAHEGEAVLTKPEAQEWRGGKGGGRGDIILQFHYHGTVIDGKKAADEFAEMIYPRLKKLEAWGH